MLFLILIIAAVTLLYAFIKNRYSYWKNLGFPQCDPVFPYGNLKDVNTKIHTTDFTIDIYQKYKSKSPLVGIYLLTQPVGIITDLDLIKSILIKDFNSFTDRPIYYNEKDDPLSAHLFSLEGAKWRPLRSKLTSSFTSGKMKFMFPTIVKVADELEKAFNIEIETNKKVDLHEILAKFTTDVIGTCAFGIECNSLRDSNAVFRKYGKKIFEQPRQSTLGRAFKTAFVELSRFLKVKNVRDDVSEFFLNSVKETVAYREKNNIKRNDFMDLLIELKNNDNSSNKLTIEQIAAQAFVFFIAGFETSSTNMTFTLYELAKNQEIQDKVRDEICTVLSRHNGELNYEAMLEMKYLDQVITETLRMYPPLVNLPRKAMRDYKIENTDLMIPAGVTVFIPAYAIHHDPEIYPNPEIYDPDNFTPENIQSRHPTTFLGFGDGPRNCIGLRFGKMQAKIGLIRLLKNFKFDVSERTPRKMTFAMNRLIVVPGGDLHLKIEKV